MASEATSSRSMSHLAKSLGSSPFCVPKPLGSLVKSWAYFQNNVFKIHNKKSLRLQRKLIILKYSFQILKNIHTQVHGPLIYRGSRWLRRETSYN